MDMKLEPRVLTQISRLTLNAPAIKFKISVSYLLYIRPRAVQIAVKE